MKELGFHSEMSEILGRNNIEYGLGRMFDQVVLHNATNEKLVPTFPNKEKGVNLGVKDGVKLMTVSAELMNGSSKANVGSTKVPKPAPFLNKKDKFGALKTYRYIGLNSKGGGVYKETRQLGAKSSGYKIVEYNAKADVTKKISNLPDSGTTNTEVVATGVVPDVTNSTPLGDPRALTADTFDFEALPNHEFKIINDDRGYSVEVSKPGGNGGSITISDKGASFLLQYQAMNHVKDRISLMGAETFEAITKCL
jgi:hypothetical protein